MILSKIFQKLNFSKIRFFFLIGGSSTEKNRKGRGLVPVQKSILIKILVPARPARTGGFREPGIRYLEGDDLGISSETPWKPST